MSCTCRCVLCLTGIHCPKCWIDLRPALGGPLVLALLASCAVPASVGERRVIEDRARLCRAGTVTPWQCLACMDRASQACVVAGFEARCGEDWFEPERSCY